jgi:2-oxoglutarate dehydrogenase complex dehydrogenase (E1) component-like enzyme
VPERRCVFIESLEAEYPFLKEDQQVGEVLCSICKSQFSIEHGSRSDILQHIKKRKHAIAAETKSCSKKVKSYFTKETITDESKQIASEGLFAFHAIKHNHFFRSVDCTPSVIRRLHEEKLSCGRTKCDSTVVNVLAPFAMQQIFEELEGVKHHLNLFILQI